MFMFYQYISLQIIETMHSNIFVFIQKKEAEAHDGGFEELGGGTRDKMRAHAKAGVA
jgi:hypothetical protein